MDVVESLRLLPGTSLASEGGGWTLVHPVGALQLSHPTDGIREALSEIVSDWVEKDALLDIVEARDGWGVVPVFSLILDRLSVRGLLQSSIGTPAVRWAEFTPALLGDGPAWPDIPADRGIRLSPRALLRSERVGATLESSSSGRRVLLLTPSAVAVVAPLVLGADGSVSCTSVPEPERECARALLSRLLAAGFLAVANASSELESHSDDTIEWEFHDLLFHARTRMGRHAGGYGGTFRRGAGRSGAPVCKDRMSEDVVLLPPEDMAHARATDRPFAEVLEARRSSCNLDGGLTLDELGRFLFRAARVIATRETPGGIATTRPYPAGGGLYELEVYPIVSNCAGLAAGLYQYRPAAHELCRMSDLTPALVRMLEFARISIRATGRPSVLLVLAARFERVFAKYDSISYALILKDVGVLMQTMYLVATAIGLSCCAVGGGDSEAFEEASGLPYSREGAVGEFALGSLITTTGHPTVVGRP